MSRLSKLLCDAEDGQGGVQLRFWCPGCEMAHGVGIGSGPAPRWTYNGNPEKPTFAPSILVRYDHWTPPATDPGIAEKIRSGAIKQTQVHDVCHSFVRDGRIQFLGDCTHKLAGQTVDLPDFPTTENTP